MTNFKRTTANTQNETRENTMMTRNIVGRIAAKAAPTALLAALLLVPNAALAQNECGAQVGTTPVDCGDSSYGSGVTYDAVGDLFIDFTNSFRSTIGTSAGGDGIDLNATGSDSITFDSATTNTEIQSSGTTGALLSVTTVDGNIVIDTEEMDADQSAAGVTHAIFAESTGSGSIDITTTGNVDAQGPNPDDSIGIEAITGSGNLSVTAAGTVEGDTAGIAATTGSGQLTINVNSGGTVSSGAGSGGAGGSSAMDLTSANQIIVNNSGDIGRRTNSLPLVIRASGGSLVLNNNDGGIIYGAIDLSGLSDGYVFNNDANATWSFERFSSSAGAAISHLGAGTLNNAGTIIFEAEDAVMAPGTDYIGDDGVLKFEVTPGLAGQTDCTSPMVSGCLSLSGGSTAGTTLVRVVFLEAPGQESPAAANTGIVLVDVGGGSTEAGDFVLDPTSIQIVDLNGPSSPGFTEVPVYAEDPVYGAVLDLGGVLDYTLLYNPDNQQHVLATVPQREGVEYVSFIHEALSIWHTTSDAVAGRQSALRDGADRGMWFRIAGEQTERESSPTLSTHGNDFTYEQDYSLWTGAAIAGFDMTASDEHVFGFHIGYVSANADYEDGSSTADDTIGATAGVYGGWWRNGITVDGTINANLLTLDHRFGSNPKDLEESESSIQSLGLRVEAGYQLPVLGDRLYVQPLVTLAYASADIKELELRDNDLSFEDATSLRTGLGLRVGGDLLANGSGNLGYWATLRHWEEHEGDGHVLFEVRDGADLAVRDDLSGAFNEIDLGVNWGNAEGDLSGYISGGAKFDKDDNNDSYNFSVGIRKNW